MGPEMSQKMSVCMCVTGRRDNMSILRNVEVILLNTPFGLKKKKKSCFVFHQYTFYIFYCLNPAVVKTVEICQFFLQSAINIDVFDCTLLAEKPRMK